MIVLGMADPGSRAHHLDVARHGAADIAGAIFVRDHALADIGDDFHVRVSVMAEAGARGDLVVVPDHEGAEGAIRADCRRPKRRSGGAPSASRDRRDRAFLWI